MCYNPDYHTLNPNRRRKDGTGKNQQSNGGTTWHGRNHRTLVRAPGDEKHVRPRHSQKLGTQGNEPHFPDRSQPMPGLRRRRRIRHPVRQPGRTTAGVADGVVTTKDRVLARAGTRSCFHFSFIFQIDKTILFVKIKL